MRQSSPATRLQHVEARVRRDLVEPRPRRAGRPYLILLLPRSEQRLLHNLFRILQRAEHPVAVQRDGAPMLLEVRPKGLLAGTADHDGSMPHEPMKLRSSRRLKVRRVK